MSHLAENDQCILLHCQIKKKKLMLIKDLKIKSNKFCKANI